MKRNNHGFTMAELLIVVAIIAVMVAIAIPVFNTQLEKGREATDLANVRDAYAEIAVGMLDGTMNSNGDTMSIGGGRSATLTVTNTRFSTGGIVTVTVPSCDIAQRVAEWQTTSGSAKVAGVDVTCPTSIAANDHTQSLLFAFSTAINPTNSTATEYLSSVWFK